jgi:protein SCO1/2
VKSTTVWALVLVPVAVLLGAFAAHLWLQAPATQLGSGTLLPQPRVIGDFNLTGDDGKPFTKASLAGHWNLVFTGYTHCPDVCPTTLATLKSVASKLGPDADKLQIVFLSIDPERDRPEALERYVHYFDPRFRGATAPNTELDRLAPQIGFVYLKVPGTTPENYSMDHSAALILINPQAQVAGYFTPPLSADALAQDLSKLIGARL